MKLGILLHSRFGQYANRKNAWNSIVEQTLLAESYGFDSIWLSEHHVMDDGFFHPIPALAALSQVTKKVTVGTAVMLVPFYHPLQLAELTGMLDIISNGRLILGVGSGYRDVEFEAYSIRKSERFSRLEESVEILKLLWTEERVTFKGKHFVLKNVSISPNQPIQKPRPQIWMGAQTKKGLERVAKCADAWLPMPATPLDELLELQTIYRDLLTSMGKPAPADVPLIRDSFVAHDEQEARRIVEDSFVNKYKELASYKLINVRVEDVNWETIKENRLVVGDPDEFIEQLRQYERDAKVNHIILRLQHVGLDPSYVTEAIKIIGTEVIPKLR